jgi:hypothetical protein
MAFPASRIKTVIYFFVKKHRFLRCEIHPGQPNLLTVIDPSGREHTERLASSEDLETRWSEVRTQLSNDGWSGPFGRDARV